MGAITDLWKSERGLLAVLLVVTAGVLAGLGSMTIDRWTDFAKWIFVTYTAGKTVTGAIERVWNSSGRGAEDTSALNLTGSGVSVLKP